VSVTGGTPAYTLNAGAFSVSALTANDFTVGGLAALEGLNLIVTDDFGCSISVWIEPQILAVPVVEAGAPKTISCLDSTATLDASVSVDNYTCLWEGPDPDFNTHSLAPVVDMPGNYYLTVLDNASGCSSSDSTMVMPAAWPEYLVDTENVSCHGDENASILFASLSGGTPPYLYSINGGSDFGTDPLFDQLGPGTFQLLVRDALGCETGAQVSLSEPDPLELFIDSLIELQFGQNHQIEILTNMSLDAIASIQWNPPGGLSCTDCLEPLADPKFSTSYTLVLTDTLGCWVEASILINRIIDNTVHIPNIFTPNGDDINDKFFIKGGNGVQLIESLDIYDRWGNHVYSATNMVPNDPALGWDGQYKGMPVNPAVYVYVARVKLYDESVKTFAGDITLTR